MKPFLVVNPQSAGGATQRHFDTISQAVRNAVGECPHAFTERPLHAAELTRKALGEGHDLVIAVGGDGTINEVVNGFFEEPRQGAESKPLKPGAALGVLPRGTGGDLRRTIGLDADLRRSAARSARSSPAPARMDRARPASPAAVAGATGRAAPPARARGSS